MMYRFTRSFLFLLLISFTFQLLFVVVVRASDDYRPVPYHTGRYNLARQIDIDETLIIKHTTADNELNVVFQSASSSNNSVATVSVTDDGFSRYTIEILGRGKGEADITINYSLSSNLEEVSYSQLYRVWVDGWNPYSTDQPTDSDQEPSILINNCLDRLRVDESFTLALDMEGFPPNTLPLFQVTSGERYARVNDSGVVTGISPGQAVITVSANTGPPENRLISTTCTIEIYENIIEIINAPQFLRVDEFVALDVLVNGLPPDRSVDWWVDATSYNYVIFSGIEFNVLNALRPGIAIVHANYITDDNEVITGSATIEIVFDEIEITPSEISLEVGQSHELAVNRAAQAQGVIWESSNPDTVEVSQAGVVTAIQAGDPVTITATLKGDEPTKGQAIVTILSDVEQIRLDIGGGRSRFVGSGGETVTVQATVLPLISTNKDLQWHSTNPGFAYIAGTYTEGGGGRAEVRTVRNKEGFAYIYARSVQNPEVTSNFVLIQWRPHWTDAINPWLKTEKVPHPNLSEEDQKAYEEWLKSPDGELMRAEIEVADAWTSAADIILEEGIKYPMAIFDMAKWWIEVPVELMLNRDPMAALKSFIFGIKSGLGIIPTALDHTIWAITQNKNWFESLVEEITNPSMAPIRIQDLDDDFIRQIDPLYIPTPQVEGNYQPYGN